MSDMFLRRLGIAAAISCAGVVFCEAAMAAIPLSVYVGYVAYIGMAVCLSVYALFCLVKLIRDAWCGIGLLTTITTLCIMIFVAYWIPRTESLSGEATQQIACFIHHLSHDWDLGWRGTCMFGYPNRSFVIPALPTMMFGPSVFSLNLGGSIFFFIGICIFSYGLHMWMGKGFMHDVMASCILLGFFQLHYVIWFTLLYEQSIFPFCFALCLAGLWMQYSSSSYRTVLLWLSACASGYMIYSYTPALGLLACMMGVLLYQLIQQDESRHVRYTISVIICLLAYFVYISCLFRHDINLVTGKQPPSGSLWVDLSSSFEHLVSQSHAPMFASFPLWGVVLLFVGMAIIGVFGWKYLYFSWWMIGIWYISVVSQGYYYYPIEFRVHRIIVVFPILFTMIASVLKKTVPHLSKKVLVGMFFVWCFFSLLEVSMVISRRHPHPHMSLTSLLMRLPSDGSDGTYLSFVPSADGAYLSYTDTMKYFLPDWKIIPGNQYGKDCIPTTARGVYVVASGDPCVAIFEHAREAYGMYTLYGKVSQTPSSSPWYVYGTVKK